MSVNPLRVVVLISGRGSNLQAILDAIAHQQLPIVVQAVISNRPGALGLQRAAEAGVATATLDHTQFPDRVQFDQALMECIDAYQPQCVVLAGFMRILTPEFVQHYQGRLLNIHPSLLPAYKGTHTHERALAAGDQWHGASVHLVTAELDGGPVLAQARVPVLSGDDANTLAQRVLVQEHRLYPSVLRWLAEGRMHYDAAAGQLRFDGRPLDAPVLLDTV